MKNVDQIDDFTFGTVFREAPSGLFAGMYHSPGTASPGQNTVGGDSGRKESLGFRQFWRQRKTLNLILIVLIMIMLIATFRGK